MNINSLQILAHDGDKAATEKLFTILAVRFRLFAQRRIWDGSDAEEVVQDALMAILKKHKEIEFKTSFVAWAHRVLENEILRHYRRKGYREMRFGQTAGDVGNFPMWDPDPELKRKLLDCLKKIGSTNNRYARILNLHYQGYATEEVCEKLNLTPNHSYVLLSRARSMLEACLERGDVK